MRMWVEACGSVAPHAINAGLAIGEAADARVELNTPEGRNRLAAMAALRGMDLSAPSTA